MVGQKFVVWVQKGYDIVLVGWLGPGFTPFKVHMGICRLGGLLEFLNYLEEGIYIKSYS